MENIELKTKYIRHLFPEEKGQPTAIIPVNLPDKTLYERRYGDFEYEQLPGGFERSKNTIHAELVDADGKLLSEYFLRSNSFGEGKSGYVVEYWDGDRDKPREIFQSGYSDSSEEVYSTAIHIDKDGQATLDNNPYFADFKLGIENLKDELSFIEVEQVKKFVAEVLNMYGVDVSKYSFSYSKGHVRTYTVSGVFNIEVNLDRKELNIYKPGENYPSFMYSDGKIIINDLFHTEKTIQNFLNNCQAISPVTREKLWNCPPYKVTDLQRDGTRITSISICNGKLDEATFSGKDIDNKNRLIFEHEGMAVKYSLDTGKAEFFPHKKEEQSKDTKNGLKP